MPTADQIITRYLELRDYMEAEDKAFSERMEPYRKARAALEGAAALMIAASGPTTKHISCEAGTVFKTETLSVKCADVQAFHNFVFERNARQFLTAHVAKESVKEWMESNGGHPPPGVDVTFIHKVQFRRS